MTNIFRNRKILYYANDELKLLKSPYEELIKKYS